MHFSLTKIIKRIKEDILKNDIESNADELIIYTYLQMIRQELPLHDRKEEKSYLQNLSILIHDYAESSDDTPLTIDRLTSTFGEPKDVAAAYVQSLSAGDIKVWYKKKSIKMFSLFAIVAAIIIAITMHFFLQWQNFRHNGAPVTVTYQHKIGTPDDDYNYWEHDTVIAADVFSTTEDDAAEN